MIIHDFIAEDINNKNGNAVTKNIQNSNTDICDDKIVLKQRINNTSMTILTIATNDILIKMQGVVMWYAEVISMGL